MILVCDNCGEVVNYQAAAQLTEGAWLCGELVCIARAGARRHRAILELMSGKPAPGFDWAKGVPLLAASKQPAYEGVPIAGYLATGKWLDNKGREWNVRLTAAAGMHAIIDVLNWPMAVAVLARDEQRPLLLRIPPAEAKTVFELLKAQVEKGQG